MAAERKEDLRIQRTKEAIRTTFEDMICEMDYEQISIKELAQRARINRKTFYLHYNTLDDLLREIQNEMAQNFIKRTQGLERPRDMDKITREFFLCSEELGKLGERITCSGNYKYISRKITNDIMNQTWKTDSQSSSVNPYIQNVVMTYVAQSTLEIYKQWIADGKKIPIEDIINIATQLICNGVNGLCEVSATLSTRN
ncbi:TetR/AcrR family transcriptional regulator C-terminal domain-containing protein [Bacteroides congonensis]|uniref:TetR/AcrR family transcriptional regulator n=1 Tax=Bacteroides congonensis TaxID=1871006 RepID=UPI0023C67DA2|nr:TetR/AcrR family transcriptional regulator [Lachnospiraceae bacterium]